MFLAYRRCGDDSAQCIKVTSTCDGINDCVNEWDEALTTCYTETEQLLFPTGLNEATLTKNSRWHVDCMIYVTATDYDFTLLSTGTIELYDNLGLIATYNSGSCPCNANFTSDDTMLSVHVEGSARGAFIA